MVRKFNPVMSGVPLCSEKKLRTNTELNRGYTELHRVTQRFKDRYSKTESDWFCIGQKMSFSFERPDIIVSGNDFVQFSV